MVLPQLLLILRHALALLASLLQVRPDLGPQRADSLLDIVQGQEALLLELFGAQLARTKRGCIGLVLLRVEACARLLVLDTVQAHLLVLLSLQ